MHKLKDCLIADGEFRSSLLIAVTRFVYDCAVDNVHNPDAKIMVLVCLFRLRIDRPDS